MEAGFLHKRIPTTQFVPNKVTINSEGSLGSKSYHLIGKNDIRLPPTDVFIDLARF